MNENSENQDSASESAREAADGVAEEPTPFKTAADDDAPRTGLPGTGLPGTGLPGARRAVGPVTLDPATNIKMDADNSEPMRQAGRLPRLPSDEEIAASLAKSVREDEKNGTAATTAPLTVSASAIRPPAEDVARRQAAMEKAANTKPVLARVFQVLIAVFYPIVLLVLAIRLVTSSVFLWVEYHRPGFPADSFGFSTEDRLTYGSYTVDYLLNFASPRYLGELVNSSGDPLFLAREVGHMADVKSVMVMAFVTALSLVIVMVIGMVYLGRRTHGGTRRGLFAGSIATLAVIVALGVFAVTGWEKFFTEFHRIFFADGSWTFYTDDTLIRLFPSQFWMDAGLFIGCFVLVAASLTLAFTWPTKDRRQIAAAARRPGRHNA